MAASPELRRPSSPVEFKVGSFLALPSAEDRVWARQFSEVAVGPGVECRTPISKDCKIPPISTCPPAPKKTRQMEAAASCKRRLSELELFRVGPELMGMLFRPLGQPPRGGAGGACLPATTSPPAAKKRRGRE